MTTPASPGVAESDLLWWDDQPPPPRGPRLRTWLISLVAAAALGSLIGGVSLQFGGGTSGVPGSEQIATIPQASASATVAAGSPLTPANVSSFDPVAGGSGFASSGGLFQTQHYRSAAFSGLKPGVGLVADFGHPVTVASVAVTASVAGTGVQLLAGDQPPTGSSPLSPASATVTPTTGTPTTIKTTTATAHRYWMLWCTQLGSDGQGGWWAAFTQPTYTG